MRDVDNHFFQRDIKEWLKVNSTNNKLTGQLHIPWSIQFLFAVWLIWKRRNHMVFRSLGPNPHLAKEIVQRAFEYNFCAAPAKEPIVKIVRPIQWSKPEASWLKLNTDGSSLGNPGLAGGGGLIRNEEGGWVAGFTRKIGITTSFLAKLWALRDGLKLCVNRSILAVEVELDAKSIVDVVANAKYSNIFASALLDDCRHLIQQIPQIRFKHIFQEANRCADALARMGGLQEDEFIVFESPPVDISILLDFDLSGVYLNRLCPVALFEL